MKSTAFADLSPTYRLLRATYGLVPVVAGADKFFGILTNWEAYLPAWFADVLPVSPAAFMMVVGLIEIAAGLTVLTKFPRLGAYVVMAWLTLIAGAVASAGFLDIAVRDLVMAVGAFTLSQLAAVYGPSWVTEGRLQEGATGHAAVH
jgi:hypothetical protein